MNEMTFNIETSISDVQNTMERTLIRVPPVLQEKTVDANHVSVQADSGYEGLSQVNIDWHPNLEAKNVTENGHYEPSEGYDFIGEFTVDVQPPLQDKTITENGTYSHDSGFYGLDEVTVDVQPELQSKTATENGTVVADSDYYGLSQVTVNVQPELQEKTITSNGTYTADEGYYGLGQITVDCPAPHPQVFTGTKQYQCAYYTIPMLQDLGVEMSSSDLESLNYVFSTCHATEIPFTINCKSGTNISLDYAINSTDLRECPTFSEFSVGSMNRALQNNYYIRNWNKLFEKMDTTYINGSTNSVCRIFYGNYSLREIPTQYLSKLYSLSTGNSSVVQYYGFCSCGVLDEIVGIPVSQNVTSNSFTSCFNGVARAKRIAFGTEGGAPIARTWKSQTIDLTTNVGYAGNDSQITSYNSGITTAKKVTDAASYAALKNDPDWYTLDVAYSRYNHDSAVETINSLPDVSSGSSNSIKFKGASGSATDGGAINTLTADEIAVATAKGWTVTLA